MAPRGCPIRLSDSRTADSFAGRNPDPPFALSTIVEDGTLGQEPPNDATLAGLRRQHDFLRSRSLAIDPRSLRASQVRPGEAWPLPRVLLPDGRVGRVQ